MKIIDKENGQVVAEIVTNHSMTIDEAIDCMGWTVNDEGEIIDDEGNHTNVWYDYIDLDYSRN